MKWSDLIKVSVLLSLSGSLFAKNIPDYSPSGKLTQTFPRHAGQVPVAYNFCFRLPPAGRKPGSPFPLALGKLPDLEQPDGARA